VKNLTPGLPSKGNGDIFSGAEMIEVFTTITDSYRYSRELALFLTLFQKCLPENTQLSLVRRIGDDAAGALTLAMAARLEKKLLPEYFLVLKEPSLLVGKDAISILDNFLIQYPGIDCVLPSDIRGVPGSSRSPDYLSQRGFEIFVSGMDCSSDPIIPYDGREPFMFLVRSRALVDMGHSTDVFQVPGLLGNRTAISPKAYIHPFFEYYTEKREEVALLVPESVLSVLDIGCTRGGFGGFLKTQRGCRVTGVEMNPVEGERARAVLDDVIIGDALQVDVKGSYDCVTCLDVIEHFEDPSRLLGRIRDEFLCDKGWLVLSVPNVGHWSIVEDLLAGRWDYLPVGILCNTHLRFFTRSSIAGYLEEHGFRIEKIVGTKLPVSEDMLRNLQVLEKYGMEIDFQSLEINSYLVLAKKM
jgi:2-polyprenyl-3-methyl-5-hydroxy-6-metoxy-1,4-benzoquinol methylase